MSNQLEITQLYINNNSGKTLIHGVDLYIKSGLVNVLIGESGSGKTLTAKAIIQHVPDNLTMTHSTLKYNGKQYKDMYELLGTTIGYISQDYSHSFNEHTKIGKQLIAIYRAHFAVNKQQAKTKVLEALAWVELNGQKIMEQYRFTLSGGQLARVQIASVLMLKPQLIIADEPTGALDAVTGYHLMTLIRHLADVHKATLLVITHNLTHVLSFSDYIQVIKDGSIVDRLTIDNVKQGQMTQYSETLFRHRSQLVKDESYD
ncbi:ATP-binding cassette domain-containing protein [Staphylococcus arlettae]|uniref:ATP-binding cassette domain-containing protein n=1 Tax=Staphylococcus arlettae TaxID=29378 RepID=UPI001E2B53A2|nr:ATP-binding cassette domain-containing protein [Staphylococcus arlettae]MCD8834369.1 ATP-binding cassette domain-containing protein [Staphylococcus arlettae]